MEKGYYVDTVVRQGDGITPLGPLSGNDVLIRQIRLSGWIKGMGKAHPHDVIAVGFTLDQLKESQLGIYEQIDFEFKLD